jgi:hypothetical protein
MKPDLRYTYSFVSISPNGFSLCHPSKHLRLHSGSESYLDHSVPNSTRILAWVNVDSSQNRFHSRSEHIVSRSSVLHTARHHDVLVQPNPAGNVGQIGVATNGRYQSAADTWNA